MAQYHHKTLLMLVIHYQPVQGGSHLTMHRTIRLMDYYQTVSGNGLTGYRANGLGLGLA